MKNILGAIIALFTALLLSFPTNAAEKVKAERTISYYQKATSAVEKSSLVGKKQKVMKATRVDAKSCMGTAFTQMSEGYQVDNNPPVSRTTTYFAAPEFCMGSSMWGVGIYGDFDEMEYVGSARGLAYFRAIAFRELPNLSIEYYIDVEDKVFAIDDRPIEITLGVGRESVIAYPDADVLLSGTVAGWSSVAEASSCPRAGSCTFSELGASHIFIDREFPIQPGSSIFNQFGRSVLMFWGSDKGRSLATPVSSLYNGAYDLGIFERQDGKG